MSNLCISKAVRVPLSISISVCIYPSLLASSGLGCGVADAANPIYECLIYAYLNLNLNLYQSQYLCIHPRLTDCGLADASYAADMNA